MECRGGFRFGFLLGMVVGALATFVMVARSEGDGGASLGGKAEQVRARARARIDAVLAQGRHAVEEGRQAAAELRQEFEATLEAAKRD